MREVRWYVNYKAQQRMVRPHLHGSGGITISAEKHRGRVMVRVEVPDAGR